ncbi:MAG: YitT family protein [Erysipelotrichaceae bacterium]
MKIIKEFIPLLISALLMVIAVQCFFTEYSLTPGGITGLSISLSALLSIPIDVISFSISIPLFLISTLIFGKSFGIKTLCIILMLPLLLKVFPEIHITNSIILASILGGLLVGISISITIHKKCATGGTDTIARLIHLIFKDIKIPTILFAIDMVIVLSSCVISKNIMTALFSTLSLFVIMQTIKFNTRKVSD